MGLSGSEVGGRNGSSPDALIAALKLEVAELRRRIASAEGQVMGLDRDVKGFGRKLEARKESRERFEERVAKLSEGVKELARASHHDLTEEVKEFRHLERERARYWIRYAVGIVVLCVVAVLGFLLAWMVKK